jgi:type I restriction enzyme M protein
VDSLDYKEQPLVVATDEAMYRFDADQETLIKRH